MNVYHYLRRLNKNNGHSSETAVNMDSKNEAVPVSSPPPANETSVKSYDDFLQRMQLMFRDTQRRIDAIFASCTNDPKTVSKVDRLCKHVDDRRNKSETTERLILSGVPYFPGENLDLCCRQVCLALGYQTPNVPRIEAKRLSRCSIPCGSAPSILLRFDCKMDRDRFFKRYLTSMNLSLGHLGYKTSKRIYLNEDLTMTARKIRRVAVRLKMYGSLAAAFVKNGVIYVKPAGQAAAIPIYSPDQLYIYNNVSF